MTPPDDNGINFAWIIDHAWIAILGLIGVVWRQNEKIQQTNETALTEHKKASAKALEDHKEMNSKMHDDTHTELAKTITQAVAVAFEAQLHIDSYYHRPTLFREP